MYFFPMKVEEQQERIKRKKVELDLSKKIISETFEGLFELNQLDLRYNKLSELEDNAFIGLSTLAKLFIESKLFSLSRIKLILSFIIE